LINYLQIRVLALLFGENLDLTYANETLKIIKKINKLSIIFCKYYSFKSKRPQLKQYEHYNK